MHLLGMQIIVLLARNRSRDLSDTRMQCESVVVESVKGRTRANAFEWLMGIISSSVHQAIRKSVKMLVSITAQLYVQHHYVVS